MFSVTFFSLLACKKTEWRGAGVVICLERNADLHMAQLMPLPLIVSCFCKVQVCLIFLVPAHLGSPRKRAVKWVCVCCSSSFCSQRISRSWENGYFFKDFRGIVATPINAIFSDISECQRTLVPCE